MRKSVHGLARQLTQKGHAGTKGAAIPRLKSNQRLRFDAPADAATIKRPFF